MLFGCGNRGLRVGDELLDLEKSGAIVLSDSVRTDRGLVNMGLCIIATAPLCLALYFPDQGSMLTRAGALRCYDPQLFHPPPGYRGADSVDTSVAKAAAASCTSESAADGEPSRQGHQRSAAGAGPGGGAPASGMNKSDGPGLEPGGGGRLLEETPARVQFELERM